MDTPKGHILLFGQDAGSYQGLLASLQSSFQVTFTDKNVFGIFETTRRPEPNLIMIIDDHPDSRFLETCLHLKSNVGTSHLPVVVLREAQNPGDRIRWFSAGCTDYIPLDIQAEELVARVGSHVRTGQYAGLLRRTSRDSQEEILALGQAGGETAWQNAPTAKAEKIAHQAATSAADSIDQRAERQRLHSVGLLTRGIAHEINNPLNGIMNYAQLIEDRVDPSETKLKKFAAAIIRESTRVSTLVRDLVDFARHEEQEFAEVDLRDIVDHALTLIRVAIHKDGILLSIDIPRNLPRVSCRSRDIQQVLLNLILSANPVHRPRHQGHTQDQTVTLSAACIEDRQGKWLRATIENSYPSTVSELSEEPVDLGQELDQFPNFSICRYILETNKARLIAENGTQSTTCIHIDLPCIR